ncbi:hypothetical protein PRIPAC_78957, partial [Pristionchus pacificus]
HFRLVSIGQMLATRHIVFRILLLVVYVIPCALQIGTYRNLEGGSLFVKKIMILALVLVVYFAISSFLLLSKQSLLSDKTKLIQQQMMKILIIQTLIPMLIQLSPLFIYTYSMIAVALNPNLANAIFCFQLTHAFIHTSILLGTTPSYRESLMLGRMKTSTVALYSFVLSVLKMRNLSLHSLWHTAMPIYQYSVGLVTHILSILAFYLMVTKTPSTAKPFACYLMFLQLFPFPYIYAMEFSALGFASQAMLESWDQNFNNRLQMICRQSIMFFTIAFITLAIIYCFHYKYVMIGVMIGHDSFEESRHKLFRTVLFALYMIPCILQIGLYRNLKSGPLFVKNNFPTIAYLIEDPKYRGIVNDTNFFPEYLMLFPLSTTFVSYFVRSVFLALVRQVFMKQLQRHVMKILIIQAHNSVKIFEATTCSFQTIVPLSIQMTPTLINTVSLSTQTLSPGMNLKSTRKSQTQLRHKQWL